jgi:hypothetical protein
MICANPMLISCERLIRITTQSVKCSLPNCAPPVRKASFIQVLALQQANALACFTLILQQTQFKADTSIITGMEQGSISTATPAAGKFSGLSLTKKRKSPTSSLLRESRRTSMIALFSNSGGVPHMAFNHQAWRDCYSERASISRRAQCNRLFVFFNGLSVSAEAQLPHIDSKPTCSKALRFFGSWSGAIRRSSWHGVAAGGRLRGPRISCGSSWQRLHRLPCLGRVLRQCCYARR